MTKWLHKLDSRHNHLHAPWMEHVVHDTADILAAIVVFVKNSVREGISKLNKTFNHAIFLNIEKQNFNLMRNILLVFAHLPPNESFVYGNNEQSGIGLLKEELYREQ